MEETILVHRIGLDPIELPRSEIVFTDRSRAVLNCDQERWNMYEVKGKGLVPFITDDDYFPQGSAIHAFVDLSLMGGTFEKCLAAAFKTYDEEVTWGNNMLPEQVRILTEDSKHLIWFLGYAWYHRHLPKYNSKFVTKRVEEEVNWLLKEMDEPFVDPLGNKKRFLVWMSRLDFVAEDPVRGYLYHGSNKTPKRFDDHDLTQTVRDEQRFAEGYGMMAEMGRFPNYTLYNQFRKGDKAYDKEVGFKRYSRGIRPYVNRKTYEGGEILPPMLSPEYEWKYLDNTGGTPTIKTSHVGNTWERVTIYDLMDYGQYLEWMDEGLIQVPAFYKETGPPRAAVDYLDEAISSLIEIPWDQDHAERWLLGVQEQEERWAHKANALRRVSMEDREFKKKIHLATEDCSRYDRECPWFRTCWKKESMATLLEERVYIERDKPNHPQEFPFE